MGQVVEAIERASAVQPMVVVGIGGHGGSGKSALAAAIARRLPAVQVVETDSFWNGSQFELARLYDDVVAPLLVAANGRYREWDWGAGALGRVRVVEPSGVVVIEGVCALHRMFRDHEAVRVWVDAPPALRLERGVARDGEAMRSRWTDVWMPGEDAYVAADQPEQCAHIIVDGTSPL